MKILWMTCLAVTLAAMAGYLGSFTPAYAEFGDDEFDEQLEDDVEIEVDDLTDIDDQDTDQDDADDNEQEGEDSSPPSSSRHQR